MSENEPGSRFLANTLHEIRTPIQTIIGASELLLETQLTQEQNEYLHQIKFSANVLLSLANDVLDFSKIRSSEFKLEKIPFDPAELTEQTADLVSIDAASKSLELVTDIAFGVPEFVLGDPVRVQQILLNLLKNAVKFTQEGYVKASLKMTKDEKTGAKFLDFHVCDSGIGVAPDKRESIFTDYYQVDASISRKYGGTGLGLSICKSLVEAMSGCIEVKENTENGGVGSDFHFLLPYYSAGASSFSSEKRRIPENKRILIVDDSALSASSIAKKLLSFGNCEIEMAYSGEKALELMRSRVAENRVFDVVLIDLLMPVMDGWRLAAIINHDTKINGSALYLMLPEGQLSRDAKMKSLGWFNDYIRKPVKREDLGRKIVDSLLEPLDLLPVEPISPIVSSDESLASGLKILIAEDHPVNRKILDAFLKKFGAETFLAEDGVKAVQTATDNPDIKIIFMDIQMPEKDGADAAKELRGNGWRGIIIACTANSDTADFENYKKIGMDDVLVKPFSKNRVRELLEKWITVLDEVRSAGGGMIYD